MIHAIDTLVQKKFSFFVLILPSNLFCDSVEDSDVSIGNLYTKAHRTVSEWKLKI